MKLGWFVVGLGVVACDGGSTGDGAAPSPTSDASCFFKTTLSGALTATIGDTAQACVFTTDTSIYATSDTKTTVTLYLKNLAPNQTGPVSAQVAIDSDQDHWTTRDCTANVATDVKSEDKPNRYLLTGSGSCTTPATYEAVGSKPPITVAPFTFALELVNPDG